MSPTQRAPHTHPRPSRRALLAGLAGAAVVATVPLAVRSAAGRLPTPRPAQPSLPATAVSPAGAAGLGPAATLPTRREIVAVLSRVADAWIGAHADPGGNGWTRATFFTGLTAAYRVTGEPRHLAYATNWAEQANYLIRAGKLTRSADNFCAGQVYYDLHDLEPDPAKVASVNANVAAMVHGDEPTKVDDWHWVDALHMAMPPFVRVAADQRDPAVLEKLYALYSHPKRTLALYDAGHGFWYRDARWAPPSGVLSPTGRPVFWSRGNGWAMAAHAKTLELLPATDPRHREYADTLAGMAAALRASQRADGFWSVNLGDPDDFPGPETSGTGLATFGLAYGVRAGILDRKKYLPVAARAWNAMATRAVHRDGYVGYVQNVANSPDSGQPVTRDTTADFGVGAFLLAGAQLARLAPTA